MDNTGFQLDQDQKLEILSLAYEKQIDAIISHNDLAFKVFSWATTLLLALIGYSMSQNPNLGIPDRVLLTSAVLLLFSTTFWWQRQNFLETAEHGQNVENLHRIFHLTGLGYFGSEEPALVREIHMARAKSRAKFGLSHYNLTLLIMTMITMLVLWTR